MAGNWIKMRAELETNPHFLRLADWLINDCSEHGLLIYTCGEDALGIGVMPPSQLSVTERALRCVTLRALHDVTLALLLRVWSAINTHCKVEELDAICAPMNLLDLDKISQVAGFGKGMEVVGWAVQDRDSNSLRFPNFLEYNEPLCLRPKGQTNAERQRAYRERQKAKQGALQTVTTNNGREEKRREEKNTRKPPTPFATKGTFRPPSLDELTAYCRERKNRIDPQTFIDHYTSNGWRVGRNLMKDWRAAVRTWERNDFGGKAATPADGKLRSGNYAPIESIVCGPDDSEI